MQTLKRFDRFQLINSGVSQLQYFATNARSKRLQFYIIVKNKRRRHPSANIICGRPLS